MDKRKLKRVLKLASERIGDDIFSEFACHAVRGAAREILKAHDALLDKGVNKYAEKLEQCEEYVDWFRSQKPIKGGLHSEFAEHDMYVKDDPESTVWWTYMGALNNERAMNEKKRFLNYLIKQI